jgi:glyoxylase-like metal-dependent hydrolase (beta-lactamase superfamily II)
MATVHLLHAGYTGERTASSVTFVRDGAALIVVDPGMVALQAKILNPLTDLGVSAKAVTHVFLTHHHPDHTMNVGLFPNAEVVDHWARYKADLWIDMPEDPEGYRLSPKAWAMRAPGHTRNELALIVEAEDGVYAMTHAWWHADRTPKIDPLAEDPEALEATRARILATADVVIPAHGGPFRTKF